MSALGSVVTAIGGATGDQGSYSLDTLTKNQGIQSALNNLIGSYNSQVSNDSTDLNSYIKNYLAGTNQATQNTAQETGAIDRYYNGDVARQLAGLRAQQSQLGNQSVAQALAYQRGNQNRALVTGGGGDNSYDNRIGIGTAANLNLANNLQNLTQQRSDINQVDQSQLALAGQRNNLADALAARSLVPAQVGQSMLSAEGQDLNGITGISNANNLFGVQYNPSMADYGGQITGGMFGAAGQGLGAVESGALTAGALNSPAFTGGSSGGGGGGGGGGL